ncbi:hypothetical protein CBFG_01598 [Clostridiales bacterium 1_7_47FAA]|uniref:TnsA endonuclease N-terminal domain-containing protein n=1 Tax=Enterocloster hominis (ex Hitch et al. 2024) TaxID=1917870 RepID=A0ABV1D0A4_9FIRM|nr:hypothetical protein CBFG_01598 [Clostridiales bacterium 1_7_47FAA]
MDKAGGKRRDISFRSEKNQKVVCVHSREAREYARILETDDTVECYDTCHLLEMERYQFVNPIDNRKDYFDVKWATDFVLYFVDGNIGIREIATEAMLAKKANIEKLEFSRRYWSFSEVVKDWKIIIMTKKGE